MDYLFNAIATLPKNQEPCDLNHNGMSKNKKHGGPPVPLSPKKYIVTRARKLPVYKCLISKDWEGAGMATVVIMRKHVNDHVTAAFYLVDLLALGVKDTHFVFNVHEQDCMDLIPRSESMLKEIPYVLAHNIIYGAVAFAEEHGYKQHKDFEITQYLLEEDTDDIEQIDVPFGKNGKPVFISEYVEGDEVGDEDEGMDELEEDPDHDYHSFTDDDWRNFLNNAVELSKAQIFYVIGALYKKWIDKYQPSIEYHISELQSDNVEITYDILHPQLAYRPTRELGLKMGETLFTLTKTQPEQIPLMEKKLNDLIALYPEQPTLYHQLAACAQIKGDMVLHRAIHEQTMQKFPNYLYSKISLVNLLVNENRMDEVPALLNNAFSLDMVMPGRKVFHITEFEDYFATLVRYFSLTDNLRRAQLCFSVLSQQRQHEPDDHFVPQVSNVVQWALLEHGKKRHEKAMEYAHELRTDQSLIEIITKSNSQQ